MYKLKQNVCESFTKATIFKLYEAFGFKPKKSLRKSFLCKEFPLLTKSQINSSAIASVRLNYAFEEIKSENTNMPNYLNQASKDYKYLQNIKFTQVLYKLHLYITGIHSTKNKYMVVAPMNHCKTTNAIKSTKRSCITYLHILRKYIQSLKTRKLKVDTLFELDNERPVCLEALCKTLDDFVQKKTNGIIFDFDGKVSKEANITNALNVVMSLICKIKNKVDFRKTIEFDLWAKIYGLVKDKKASDGIITKNDVIIYLLEYGDYISCSNKNSLGRFVIGSFYRVDANEIYRILSKRNETITNDEFDKKVRYDKQGFITGIRFGIKTNIPKWLQENLKMEDKEMIKWKKDTVSYINELKKRERELLYKQFTFAITRNKNSHLGKEIEKIVKKAPKVPKDIYVYRTMEIGNVNTAKVTQKLPFSATYRLSFALRWATNQTSVVKNKSKYVTIRFLLKKGSSALFWGSPYRDSKSNQKITDLSLNSLSRGKPQFEILLVPGTLQYKTEDTINVENMTNEQKSTLNIDYYPSNLIRKSTLKNFKQGKNINTKNKNDLLNFRIIHSTYKANS